MSEKHYDEEGRVIRENRSQAKREREHIKIFARELLKLPAHQYPLLPIDETLQAALVEGKRLTGNALSRHLNYLTRLLDEQGYEEILAAHEHVNHPYLHSPGKQQRLLAGDADIYGELLGRYADLDLQHLRQLVREAQKLLAAATEVDDDTPAAPNNAPNKYQRRLQKYLQGLALFYEE